MRLIPHQYNPPITQPTPGDTLLLANPIHVRSLSAAAGATTWREKLDMFEFIWLLEGKIRLARGQTLAAGDLALFGPGTEMVFHATENGAHALIVEFQISVFPTHWGPPNHWPRLVHTREGDICGALLSYLNTISRAADDLALQSFLQALLVAYVTGKTTAHRPAQRVLSPHTKAALAEIRRRLAKHPFAPISLDQIAKKVGLSCPALNRHFRRCVGRTPIAEIYLARLDRAVELIARTDLPLSVVAAMTGFSNESHLAKHCRAQFGMSSGILRRRLQSGEMPHLAKEPTAPDNADGFTTA